MQCNAIRPAFFFSLLSLPLSLYLCFSAASRPSSLRSAASHHCCCHGVSHLRGLQFFELGLRDPAICRRGGGAEEGDQEHDRHTRLQKCGRMVTVARITRRGRAPPEPGIVH